MRKRTNSLIILMAALAALLAACGQGSGASSPAAAPTGASGQPAASAASAAGQPASGAPVDIELWAAGTVSEAAPPPSDWAAYQQLRDKLGVNLKLSLLPSSFSDQDTKINAAAASNSLPDLFYANRDTWRRLVDNGLVAQVDDLLPQMPERTKSHYSDPDRNKLVSVDGKMYGLADPGAIVHSEGLVIRKDWLDKLGLQAPKTLDDFLAVAKAFTEKDPDGNGKNDTYGLGGFIESPGFANLGLGQRFGFIYGAYGVAGTFNLSSADKFGLNVRDPNYLKATQFIKQLNDAKVIDPDWPTLTKDEFRARWKQGKYGIMYEQYCALSCAGNYKDFDTNFPNGEWMVLAPPAGPDGKSSTGVSVKSARIYAISQKAMDAGKGPAIARLLEWLTTDEGYYLLGFGQEGVNYKRDANGYVTTEGIDPAKAWTTKEQQPITQLRTLVYYNSDVELKARYVPYKTKNGRAMEPLAYYKAISSQPYAEATAATLIVPPANGADFTRYYSENLTNFVLGQQPLSEQTWAEYLAGLDGLGAKDLEASAKQTLTEAGFFK